MLKDSENVDRWLAALSSSMLNSETVEMDLNWDKSVLTQNFIFLQIVF